jgi:hypothetical protein
VGSFTSGWEPEIVKIVLFCLTLAVLARFKLPEPLIVLVAAVIGLLGHPWIG